ncbi:MAG: hypothetical protein U0L83_03265 [Muribaculaceae bacterium]|nr:hypothetical protein [Muribaculaceae bacterium]
MASQGEDVQFFVADNGTRTMYQDDWDAENAQSLYWGNYISTNQDKIRVFCANASSQIGTYTVTPKETDSNVAGSVTKEGEKGVQWGAQGTAHTFYAFYPAERCGSGYTQGTNVISAEVTPSQLPATYRTITAGDVAEGDAATIFKRINANTVQEATSRTVTYGQPDMSAALMMAKTETQTTDFGQPVALHFNVVADVLDLTINGPVVPNTLNGNNKPTADYISIHSVEVKSKSGKAISGNFNINLDGITKNGNYLTVKNNEITNGNDYVLIQTSDAAGTLYPRLNVRSNTPGTDNSNLDQLRLRAFLIPGQVTDLSDLQIIVETDCGTYTQDLNTQTMATGQIHRVKLKYFRTEGQPIDYGSWIAQLDPNIYLTELSIPGSWYSYSFGDTGNDQYQTLNLEQQYKAGVRAFQLHCGISQSRTGNPFDGYTYNFSVPYLNGHRNISLESVLNDIGSYMQGHPNEFCVVQIGMAGNYVPILQPDHASAAWLGKIAEVVNNNKYVYKAEITANTTIKDVISSDDSRIIVKINTNNTTNETATQINALCSRWEENSAITPATISLKWGGPIAPDALSTLKWCYTEADKIGTNNAYATVAQRKSAIEALVTLSRNEYISGVHNTWFECSVGGKLIDYTSNQPVELANELNPYLLQVLSDPTREACPMGLVLFNFVGNDTYVGNNLIARIVKNNRSFTLRKKGSTSTQSAADKTNSSFKNNPGSAIR